MGVCFHIGMVAENKMKVNGEEYQWMLVHEHQKEEDKFATIRVTMTNKYSDIEKEMLRYVFRGSTNRLLKSDLHTCSMPIKKAEDIVVHTTTRQSVFDYKFF